jgi:hypothetical protein
MVQGSRVNSSHGVQREAPHPVITRKRVFAYWHSYPNNIIRYLVDSHDFNALRRKISEFNLTISVYGDPKEGEILLSYSRPDNASAYFNVHCPVEFKILRAFLKSNLSCPFLPKMDFINDFAKEFQLRKIEAERAINYLKEREWIAY